MAQIKQLAQDPEYHPIILRVCQQLVDFTPFLTEATQDTLDSISYNKSCNHFYEPYCILNYHENTSCSQ